MIIINFSTFGTYKNPFGASFNVRDKGEFGDNVDKDESSLLETGAYFKNVTNSLEYKDIKGSINFN